ncbi:MAG: hypothetical protein HY553_05980 [Elusimicrobia bacterium]|nr:hypothetical protein [Elusimicrobiota bacterium]
MRSSRHALPAVIVALYAGLAFLSPERLHALAEEDGWIEWLTFALFGAASAGFFSEARAHKGAAAWGLAGVALLCFAVAGEEISWGQRIFGFVPSEPLLSSNIQQEANFHNLLHALFRPKWLVVGLLSAWGGAGPLLARVSGRRLGRLEPALQAAASPAALAPWSALACALIIVDPVPSTAEYVELLAGALFFAACLQRAQAPRASFVLPGLAAALTAGGLATTAWSPAANTEAKRSCADREVAALADAVASRAFTRRLTKKTLVHKRAFRAVREGYLDEAVAGALTGVECPGDDDPTRRRYLLDPWGQAYWIRYEDDRGAGNLVVYSFGPNRRRDSSPENPYGGDDLRSPQRVLDAPARRR